MNLKLTVSQTFSEVRGSEVEETLLTSPVPERTSATEEFSVLVATTIQGVEELRSAWTGLPQNLETDIDYYLHTLESDSTAIRPHVITVWKDGIAQAMLVGKVKRRKVSTTISFVRLSGPTSKVLEITNGGRIGQASSAIDKLLALELRKVSDSGEVDMVCFPRLPLHSELFQHVQELPKSPARKRVLHVSDYLVLSLTGPDGKAPAAFGGKAGRETRRKARILQDAFPGKVRLERYSRPGELDTGIRDAVAVASTTWQYFLGYCSFFDTAQTRNSLEFFAEKGWLRIYVLHVDDSPCAYLIGQLHNKSFYSQHAGYRPEFARFSVGSLLTAWALEDLATAGVEQVDLGEGRQEHHRRLGCQLRQEGTLHLYSRTWRGFSLNLLFGATKAVRVGGRYLLSELGLKRIESFRKEAFDGQSAAASASEALHSNPSGCTALYKRQRSLQQLRHANYDTG